MSAPGIRDDVASIAHVVREVLDTDGGLVERVVREVLDRVAPQGVPRFLRVRQVCDCTCTSKPHILAAIKSGELRAVKLRGVLLVPVDAYTEWIATAVPVRASSQRLRGGVVPATERGAAGRRRAGRPPDVCRLAREGRA